MAFMDWDASLETGNPTIDAQHRRLIALVNELHEAMRGGKGSSVLEHIFSELGSYTKYHFATEEKAFELYGYERREEHARQHAELLRSVAELAGKIERKELGISVDVLTFLTDWVRNHIRKEDMQYRQLLGDKDLGPLA
ncbi:MAG TPA: bacteriohemerythrin [Spirochaetales bacterium]|nr:bacteriohemerythrin [Spirochaetales bacterium]HRY54932.1 bacteriohemerythrin [Spirochaetia bacterium]HRZ65278.1 bacteriohemerythrin [Spirochaetia bacterium]